MNENVRSLTLSFGDLARLPDTGHKPSIKWRIYVRGQLKLAGFSVVPAAEMIGDKLLTGRHEIIAEPNGLSFTFRQWPEPSTV